MEKIGIIILSFKNVNDTVECINSISKVDSSGYIIRTILIDNSDSEQYLNQILSEVHVDVSLHVSNNGYAHGNNCGIKTALDDQCDYFVVLNNDTIVDNNFLHPLIAELKDCKLRIVAPIIKYYESEGIWSSGGIYRKFLCDYAMTYDMITKKRKTVFVSGCCLATTKDIFNKIGLFDESCFMYNEDVDFCYRAINVGADIWVLPASTIYHKVSKSSGANSPFQLYYTYRNRLIFANEKYSGLMRVYAVVVNILKICYRALKFTLSKEKEKSIALLYAIKDYKNHSGRFRY